MSSPQHGYLDKRFPVVVNENFHCPICFHVLRDPVQCRRNEHYFCLCCITKHLEIAQTCPVCQDGLTLRTLKEPSRIVAEFLATLKISCEFASRGCKELIELKSLRQHTHVCDFAPVTCSNEGCSKPVNRKDKKHHENEVCRYRKIKCTGCGKRVQFKKYDTHGCVLKGVVEDLKEKCDDMRDQMDHLKNIMAKMDERQKAQDKTIKNMATMISEMNATMKELTTQERPIQERPTQERPTQERPTQERPTQERPTNDPQRNILIVGGHDGESYLNTTEMYNTVTKTWELLGAMRIDRLAPSTFVYQNNVIVAGGFNGDFSTDRMEGMNTTRDPKTWRDFPATLPLKCNRHKIVSHQNRLYITGGENSEESKISDAIYEVSITPPHSAQIVCRMPEPRVGHGAVLHGNKVVIVGGRTTNRFKDATKSVISFDISTRKCQELTPLPNEVSQMAVVRHRGNLLILGGQDKEGNVLDSVVVYNIETGRNKRLPGMKVKRAACAAVLLENLVVVMGGRDDKKNYLNSVECFSLETQKWKLLPEMKTARMYGCAVVLPDATRY